MRLDEIAEAVGGVIAGVPDQDLPPVVFGPVVHDSRLARPGSLFVALKGERTDGHDHVGAAVEAGAVAALAARPVGTPTVVVDDVLAALGRLARAVHDRLAASGHLTTIGLTGSSGKTSTKDLLAAVLETSGVTVATAGSFNNEVGLPLTVLSADTDTQRLVLEMGARGAGHIADLCAMAPPRIGVVLNIGTAHAGEFGSKAATAAAKRELVEALPSAAKGGVAVLNSDDPYVVAMGAATSARIITFGVAQVADVRAVQAILDERGRAAFELRTPAGAAQVQLAVIGKHQVSNALAVAAVAHELGMAPAEIAAALSAAAPRSRWRMEVSERADGVTVVNDAYNANPDSMRAALEALVAIAGGRRTWAVLGEMRELGAASADEHRGAGRLVARLGVSRLVVVGEGARGVIAGAAEEGMAGAQGLEPVADAQTALRELRAQVRPGDVVLVKASRAAGLEAVAAGMLETGLLKEPLA